MRTSNVRIIGAADGRTPTPHDGRWVVAWDWNVKAGTLAITSTPDRAKARVFCNGEEFDEWRAQSKVQPLRPWDHAPNRPLTAVHIQIVKADAPT